ncbi:methyl-accepting chemotaxis protein [Halopseudomonas formosensis]|uniref:Methyl-accepting chemotaxis protein n=1 Tax=Halopseudomonas formosensis TaxID=1002526 RepID=A0A1I6A4A5_9GAMM|nr:methyl-accepting chemotaxis protein [Halopseudomonas formosensis]SFQ63478.1 methyl-accepting chemotaxis protein [Halopseudomonas formosensis]
MPFSLRISIATRLLLWAGLASVLFYTAVALGWYGLKLSRDSLRAVQDEQLTVIACTTDIEQVLDENRRLVLIAFQYDPEGKLSIAHDRAMSLYLEQIRSNSARIEALRSIFAQRPLDGREQELVTRFEEHYQLWLEDLDAMLALLEIEDFAVVGMRSFLQNGAEEGRLAREALAQLRSYQQEKAEAAFAEAERRYRMTVGVYLALAIVGLVLGSAAGTLTLARLRRGFGAVSRHAQAIAAGDLTSEMHIQGRDEIADLMAEFARMQANLRELIGGLRQQVELLGGSSSRLSALSDGASDMARQQSDAVISMSSAVEQLSVSIEEVGSHAESTRQITQQAAARSIESEALLQRMTAEMTDIAGAVQQTAEDMRDLERFSAQIDSVIRVINEVAEQTNLLSLNAAIEAARAGELGRGFAVVAAEVRELAERTSRSTLEIAETVKQIQSGTRAVASGLQHTVGRVEAGVGLARQADGSVAQIREGTAEVIVAVNEITEVLRGQAAATREIAQRVEGVSEGAREMSASAADSAAAAVQLEHLASELEGMAQRFRSA